MKEKIDQIIDNELTYLQNCKFLLKSCYVFNLNDDNKDGKLSKFGGEPLTGDDFKLDYNLSFLGQIQTSKIKSLENSLTENGILYFFLNNSSQTNPISKKDYETVFIENKKIKVAKPIIDTEGRSISLYESYTVPSYQESILNDLNFDDSHLQDLEEITTEINSTLTNYDYDFAHQLLGHPQAIQGTVRFWWACRYLNLEGKEIYSKEEIEKIQAEENNFILLLQINFADPKIEIDIFGDAIGYFGIHINDLKSNNFSNTILVTQNT